MSYQRKTVDTWEIQGRWYGTWECENIEHTLKDAKRSLKEYFQNSLYTQYRIVKIRVKVTK